MIKRTLLASLVASGFATPAALAAEQSPHTITGNVGFFSQYVFRGLRQTDGDPALQGGLDYGHSSGLYLGTWASNINWLTDSNAYKNGGSLEWDFYGGYKSTIGQTDFGFDVGALYYWYPGDPASGFKKANTTELYGALSWKWLSAKYSHSIDDKTFGVDDSRGTWYLDLTATVPVTDKFSLVGHWGKQKFKGDAGSDASYEDWKIGASYSLPKAFTIGAFYTGTSMNKDQEDFYTINDRRIGKDTFVVYLQKTF